MIKGIHHISMKCQNEEEYSQDRKWFTFVNNDVFFRYRSYFSGCSSCKQNFRIYSKKILLHH